MTFFDVLLSVLYDIYYVVQTKLIFPLTVVSREWKSVSRPLLSSFITNHLQEKGIWFDDPYWMEYMEVNTSKVAYRVLNKVGQTVSGRIGFDNGKSNLLPFVEAVSNSVVSHAHYETPRAISREIPHVKNAVISVLSDVNNSTMINEAVESCMLFLSDNPPQYADEYPYWFIPLLDPHPWLYGIFVLLQLLVGLLFRYINCLLTEKRSVSIYTGKSNTRTARTRMKKEEKIRKRLEKNESRVGRVLKKDVEEQLELK
ncbi:hypothetical protein ADUPG1_011994 [Aduncisulcus paluster]|uniref:ATP synthase F0 subunit 8 n=1 Tax=Aduncisulcus paluster TaxID=2918883 RepID=A0ABQ5JXX8_9EUKA|nr:hypothetical protein ADUPG1_011994 [Aduncisulcus paluster]